MLSQRLIDGLNQQVNLELSSSYFYLAVSTTFSELGLSGMAHWMRAQSAEELTHASRFLKFMRQCDVKIEFATIEKPELKCECSPDMECTCSPDNCSCVAELFSKALYQEQRVTGHVTSLAELAIEEKQYGALSLFQEFLNEQIEEEHSVHSLCDRLRISGTSGESLLLIDFELAKRECICSSQCLCK